MLINVYYQLKLLSIDELNFVLLLFELNTTMWMSYIRQHNVFSWNRTYTVYIHSLMINQYFSEGAILHNTLKQSIALKHSPMINNNCLSFCTNICNEQKNKF